MDQVTSTNPTQSTAIPSKRQPFILFLIIGIIILLVSGLGGYFIGYTNAINKQLTKQTNNDITKKLITHPTITPTQDTTTSYILSYSIPSGWRRIVWNPAPNSSSSAILSPDYTSVDDPNPTTGLSIIVYRYISAEGGNYFSNLQQLKTNVENQEENLQKITPTTIAGFPGFHAVFIDTDANRTLDEYSILKGHDQWIIRIITGGLSLSYQQQEEQKYGTQINEFLQSIQFQE